MDKSFFFALLIPTGIFGIFFFLGRILPLVYIPVFIGPRYLGYLLPVQLIILILFAAFVISVCFMDYNKFL